MKERPLKFTQVQMAQVLKAQTVVISIACINEPQ